MSQLFSGGVPAREIVSAVRKRVPGELNLSDLRESLGRVRAVFDFPAPIELSEPPAGAAHSKPLGAAPPVIAAKHVPPAEGSISLKNLVDGGQLPPGTTIEAKYLGQHHTAEILADGRVRYAGTVYDSLSGSGSAMRIAVKQPDESSSWSPSTDGWRFWRVLDEKTGKLVTLMEIRRRAAKSLSPT
jgi:hypothetical protein